jgi:3,4-dihydroxy-9,10-secoandrosta-1,3,5(10)-triene-9,17-dione 4,5-dioxygenase
VVNITGLGYLWIEGTNLDAWRAFGTGILGLMEGKSTDSTLLLRADDKPFRVAITSGDGDRLLYSGWEVPTRVAFDDAVAELEAAGVAVKRLGPDDAAERRVHALARFADPGGAELELFWQPIVDPGPFVSPAGVGGFVTGDMGMGHCVMVTPNFDETVDFYLRVLGFRMSDFMMIRGTRVQFMHCNARHHSLALAEGPRSMIAHFMVEAQTIDDVGYALDRVLDNDIVLRQTLGRHSNDHMLSFYAQTPGRFEVEFGWGGRRVDDATWTTAEYTKGSFWGHRRVPKPAP